MSTSVQSLILPLNLLILPVFNPVLTNNVTIQAVFCYYLRVLCSFNAAYYRALLALRNSVLRFKGTGSRAVRAVRAFGESLPSTCAPNAVIAAPEPT